ncbi:hypothetical protein ACSRUE_34140 [Sorangium sp. KYC3313]|uniref:hypothetical protein n=1 Tax=Sorangium sp. KYC3313 TaxID=3449740 RepID=UPI003F8CA7EA
MSNINPHIEALAREAKERYAAYIDIQCHGGSPDEVKAALALRNQAEKNLLEALHGKPGGVTRQQALGQYAEELSDKMKHGR